MTPDIPIPGAVVEELFPIYWRQHQNCCHNGKYEFSADLPHGFCVSFIHADKELCYALIYVWACDALKAMNKTRKEYDS